MQAQHNLAFAARTNLKGPSQRVSILGAVMAKTSKLREAAVIKFDEAVKELENMQRGVDRCRATVQNHTAELVSLEARLNQARRELPPAALIP